MNRRRGIPIGIIFVLATSAVMLLAFTAVGFFTVRYMRHVGPGGRGGPPLDAQVISFMLISALVGLAITFIVSRLILRPIHQISEATKLVAKGEFNVTLQENHPVRELTEISGNFNLMVRALKSIETLRTDFVVNVSHEFKTPIAAIEGYATLLQDRELAAQERTAYAGMILSSAEKLSSLTGNILRLSKLESQEAVPDKERFRLDEQIRQSILLLEPQWTEKNLSIDVQLQRLDFYGSSQLLFQVWTNIIGNAVKFTPSGGEIFVGLERADGAVTVTVRDSGIGMPEEVMRHVFDKFYQGDSARAVEGNGLGLALAKRIVDLCGGHIEVKSVSGEGSAFDVRLPLSI